MPFRVALRRDGLCLITALFLTGCEPKFIAIDEDYPTGELAYTQRQEKGIVEIRGCVVRPLDLVLRRNHTITLSEAIRLAGGIQRSANLRDVRVLTKQNGTIDMVKINAVPGSDGANFAIHPGDMIFVLESY